MNKKIKKTAKSPAGIASILPGFEFMETIDLAIRFIFTIVAIMLTALFFIFIYDYATQSTYFAITKISIHGLNRLTENQALMQAELHPGDNLLNINAFKIEKRLVAHPWIQSAKVTRKPPHALEIAVQEEVPLARVDMGAPPSLIINTQGIAFTPYDPETFSMDMELPVIKGLTLEKKQGIFGFYGNLYQDVLALLKDDLGTPISAITADSATGIAVETYFPSQAGRGQSPALPTTLKLGFSQFKLKFNTAGKIFHYLEQQGTPEIITTMDLFNLERVIVTPGRHAPGTDITGGA
ncbi:cell division protein FtsQ/DivIB [Desulfocicer niacini]